MNDELVQTLVLVTAGLDKDEALALAAAGRSGETWNVDWTGMRLLDQRFDASVATAEYADREEAAAHIARHDPARALREAKAKRELIDLAFHYGVTVDNEWGDGHEAEEIRAGNCDDHGAEASLSVLRMLAAVYREST